MHVLPLCPPSLNFYCALQAGLCPFLLTTFPEDLLGHVHPDFAHQGKCPALPGFGLGGP